jgi:hypothetical protein
MGEGLGPRPGDEWSPGALSEFVLCLWSIGQPWNYDAR